MATEYRFGVLRRILATMIVSVLSFGIAVFLTPGVDLKGVGRGIFSTALLAAIALDILNVAIRPVLIAAFAAVSVIAVTVLAGRRRIEGPDRLTGGDVKEHRGTVVDTGEKLLAVAAERE